ncbi:hypothetical protein QQ045_004109 [Rhodiola kirilowii]
MSAAEYTAANGASAYEGSGAGGKFRRKPLRKNQSTPYDRPPAAVRNPSSGNGWLSKIVDPASKFINASAHRLFSSVFRKRLLPPPQQTPPPPPAARQPVSDVNRTEDSKAKSEILDKIGDQCGRDHHVDEHVSLDNNEKYQGISELENILTQKTFTKSEIDRLTALLNSRTIEATTENVVNVSEARPLKTLFENGNVKESKSTPVPDNGINSIRYLGATSSHIPNTEVINEDIATPAELAKAYMGSRPSNMSPSISCSRGQAITKDLPLINSVVFPSQSPSMSTATKSVTRLGGPENGYITPHSRGRSAIYSMARTPYSRMQKRSDIKTVNNYSFQPQHLALEANQLSSSSSSSRQAALKRQSYVLDDDISSIGPVRRIRQKHGLLSSQRLTGSVGGSSPVIGSGVLSNYRSKDAGIGSRGANFMSVPSQSSDVAQKILQQLDKLSPPPKEKSSDRKSMQPPRKSTFTLTSDMLSGQALRSLEKIDSSKFIEASQENSKASDSVQTETTNADYTTSNRKNQLEENGPKKLTKNNSESTLHSSDRPHDQNKRTFQMSAREDYLGPEDSNVRSNGTSFAVAEGKVNLVNSSPENNPQTINLFVGKENSVSNDGKAHVSFCLDNKSSQYQTVPSGPIVSEKEDIVAYSSAYSPMTMRSNVTDKVSSSLFGKQSSEEKTTTTPLFGRGTEAADKSLPFTFSTSSSTANDSLAVQTSAPSKTMTSTPSGLSDTPKTKPDHSEGNQRAGDVDGNSSTASLNGSSTTSALFSSGSFANYGFANGSFSVQPTKASTGIAVPSSNSFASAASATILPNGASGIVSAVPFSESPVFGQSSSNKDPQVSSNAIVPPSEVKETVKPATATSDIPSNPFGGISSASPNSTNAGSGFSSFMSFPTVANQGFASVSNNGDALSSQATYTGTSTATGSQNTPFQFNSSGFSPAPSFGLSGTPTFSPAPVPAATSGLISVSSSQEAGIVGSAGGSTNSLFGSNWQSSSPLFCSSTSSSTAPLSVSQFGSSAASSASIPSNSTSGSLFGSTGALTSTFSFTSTSTSTSPSPFSAPQPVFGSSKSVFSFGSAASPPNTPVFGQPQSMSNSQMSMEDSMAEDTIQASAPLTPVFGQQQSMPNSGFVFGSPSPSVTTPATSLFQFGSQPSPTPPANQSPFQAPGSFNASFNAGGSFSLGTGGGDKGGRKIVKVKRGPKKR